MAFKKGIVPWNKGKTSWNKGKTSWNKGIPMRKESKIKLSKALKGKSSWMKGIPTSEENKKKHSDFMKNYYQTHKHPMFGRKPSKESIEKAKESRKKTLLNPEVRKRLSESHRGQIAWNKGISPSVETRKKQSESAKRRVRINLKKCCQECGKEFIDKTSNNIGKFCSFKCRDHNYNSLRKSYLEKYNKKNRYKINLRQKAWASTLSGREAIKKSRLKNKIKRTEWIKEYRSRQEVYERIKAWKRAYLHTEKGWARARWDNFIRRERKRGIVVGYTKQEFLEKAKKTNGLCPICNNPFTLKYHSKHELTLDHNPPISKAEKGFVYTINMISPICRSCNSKKGNRIEEVFNKK